ncbi:unnamed protein product [Schistocephalus solidus]|uniref:Reverse transcriptase domain-containing protein n=1 Tax=Schistocephalus solidus TaxID=70667 RepID=A0A183TFB7_SCHSO|nr:unnamed protein product [Schistocephalus solidus]
MFSALLMDAYRDKCPWIRIAYRTDWHFLQSRRMWAPTCVPTTSVLDLLFADDCALHVVTEKAMQRIMDLIATGCAAKTVVMHKPPLSVEFNAVQINVNGALNFVYL